MKIWTCKIGECEAGSLPPCADGPMRNAIDAAYQRLTGEQPNFIFSGWGGELDEGERAVVDQAAKPPTETFLTRLHTEHDELRERWQKLDNFINDNLAFHALPTDQRRLMKTQAHTMALYAETLQQRIKLIEDGPRQTKPSPVLHSDTYVDPGDAIDVRVTGGGSTETPVPFGEK